MSLLHVAPAHLIGTPDSIFSVAVSWQNYLSLVADVQHYCPSCKSVPCHLEVKHTLPVAKIKQAAPIERKEGEENISSTLILFHIRSVLRNLISLVEELLPGACMCGLVAMWVKLSSCREE